jgi:hypothetical protein
VSRRRLQQYHRAALGYETEVVQLCARLLEKANGSRGRHFCVLPAIFCYSAPIVHTGHLSEEERDATFWSGFHPNDREVVSLPRTPSNPTRFPLISKTFTIAYAEYCVRGVLRTWSIAYAEYCVRRLPPVPAAQAARISALGNGSSARVGAHFFTFDRFRLPSLTPCPHLASMFSVSATESQFDLAPPEMEEQSETEPALIPLINPTSLSTPSFAPLPADDISQLMSAASCSQVDHAPSDSTFDLPFVLPAS